MINNYYTYIIPTKVDWAEFFFISNNTYIFKSNIVNWILFKPIDDKIRISYNTRV